MSEKEKKTCCGYSVELLMEMVLHGKLNIYGSVADMH